MFVRTSIIMLAAAAVVLSCSKGPVPDYLALNYDKTDHADGITVGRLQNLKGHIRSVTQYVYSLDGADENSTRRGKLITGTPVYTLQFSEEGLITEEWGYRVEDIVAHKTWYRSHRQQQSDSTIHWTDEGKMTSREVNTYDKDGILVGGFNEYDGRHLEKVSNIARSGDTLVVTESRVKNYYLKGRHVKLTATEGNRTTEIQYNYLPSGALRQEVHFENGKVRYDERFDGLGNLVYLRMARYSDEDGRLIYDTEKNLTYQRDLRMQQIDKTFDEPHTWTDTMTYQYQQGRRISSRKNGEPFDVYEYNEHNDLLRQRNEFFNEGYRYTSYDDTGNWTERISLNGDKPFYVEIRRFEYY